MSIAALGTAALAAANSFEALIAIKIIIGFAAGISATAGMRLAGTYFDEHHRHLTMGLHGGSVVLGGGMGVMHTRAMALGEQFLIRLPLIDGDPMPLLCEVVYCQGATGELFSIGCRFLARQS